MKNKEKKIWIIPGTTTLDFNIYNIADKHLPDSTDDIYLLTWDHYAKWIWALILKSIAYLIVTSK